VNNITLLASGYELVVKKQGGFWLSFPTDLNIEVHILPIYFLFLCEKWALQLGSFSNPLFFVIDQNRPSNRKKFYLRVWFISLL